MLTPRDLELLDVVGEVMRERIGEVRKEYEGKLSDLQTKVATLEAQPSPEVTRKALDDLEEVLERRFAMLPPPVSLEEVQKAVWPALAEYTQDHIDAWRRAADQVFKDILAKALSEIPTPKDGAPGKDGTSVVVEDFRTLFEAEYAKFELDSERRIMDLVQRTLDRVPVPKDGRNGTDGKDGVGFDDLAITREGRSIRHDYLRDGAVVKRFEYKTDELMDRGVWKADEAYDKGDGVTWAGSWWIAQRDAPAKPGDGESGWRLAVKKGRDGIPGAPGAKGEPGTAGKNGRDLRYRLDGSVTP